MNLEIYLLANYLFWSNLILILCHVSFFNFSNFDVCKYRNFSLFLLEPDLPFFIDCILLCQLYLLLHCPPFSSNLSNPFFVHAFSSDLSNPFFSHAFSIDSFTFPVSPLLFSTVLSLPYFPFFFLNLSVLPYLLLLLPNFSFLFPPFISFIFLFLCLPISLIYSASSLSSLILLLLPLSSFPLPVFLPCSSFPLFLFSSFLSPPSLSSYFLSLPLFSPSYLCPLFLPSSHLSPPFISYSSSCLTYQ